MSFPLSFPLTFRVGDLPVPAHAVFEVLAYFVGFRLYLRARRRRGDELADADRWSLIAALVVGAALGSKLLHHAAHPRLLIQSWSDPVFLMGGKTIVGALLGGWIAVELTKKVLGITRRTGDLYAVPLCVGIAIGRIGCFLAGLEDGTHGVATTLPWGVDLGDGVARHPVALYEVAFLAALAPWLVRRKARCDGDRFRLFMLAYLAWRLLVDSLKPYEAIFGLGGIQWACLAALPFCVPRRRAARELSLENATHG